MPARAARAVTAVLTVTALAAGLVLLAGAALDLRRDRTLPADFGSTALSGPAAPSGAGRAGSISGVSGVGRAGAVSRMAQAAQLPSPPATVRIASLNVTAEVDPVASSGGVLGVPDDPSRLGWWTGGAATGSPYGSVILDGHVDSAATGPGALFRLGELAARDRIVVTTRSGATVSYAVTARRVYPKSASLPAAVFDQRGPARLVLISCGGPFDRSAGSYLDNIVVFAVPG